MSNEEFIEETAKEFGINPTIKSATRGETELYEVRVTHGKSNYLFSVGVDAGELIQNNNREVRVLQDHLNNISKDMDDKNLDK